LIFQVDGTVLYRNCVISRLLPDSACFTMGYFKLVPIYSYCFSFSFSSYAQILPLVHMLSSCKDIMFKLRSRCPIMAILTFGLSTVFMHEHPSLPTYDKLSHRREGREIQVRLWLGVCLKASRSTAQTQVEVYGQDAIDMLNRAEHEICPLNGSRNRRRTVHYSLGYALCDMRCCWICTSLQLKREQDT
jgi:hypothetical protein